jgi:hypothetical protein
MPFGPALQNDPQLDGIAYSVNVPLVVIFPILLLLFSVNQRLPSGPAAMSILSDSRAFCAVRYERYTAARGLSSPIRRADPRAPRGPRIGEG